MEDNIARSYKMIFNASKKNRSVLENFLEEQQKRREELKRMFASGQVKSSEIATDRIKAMLKKIEENSKSGIGDK